MFKRLLRFFTRQKAPDEEIKNFSYTTDSAKIGEMSMKRLSPEVMEAYSRIKANPEQITLQDINLFGNYFLKTPSLAAGYFTLNKDLTENMCFSLIGAHIETNPKTDDVEQITLELQEDTLGNSITMKIPMQNFFEVFKQFPNFQKL